MAPTETSILTKYLLLPSPLPAILSLADFTSLFPKAHQSSPHIRTLYHDLQAQRADLIDSVSANITEEVARGKQLRRAVVKQRRKLEAEEGDDDDEIAVEQALYGTHHSKVNKHTAETIIPAMNAAVAAIEAQIKALKAEEEDLLASVRKTVGSLSDLRYGRLANAELRDEVLDGLKAVEQTCKSK